MTDSLRRAAVAVAVAAALVLAGCTGGGGGQDAGAPQDVGGAEATTTVVQETRTQTAGGDDGGDAGFGSADGGDFGDVRSLPDERIRIRTGEVSLEVETFGPAVENLTGATRRYGGFVSDTDRERHRDANRTWTTGRVVLRVPRENFSALLSAATAEGTVLSVGTDTQDVTEQVVDLQARLENLRAQRDRLRELYDRANETEDVLRVGRRLSDVQSEIERIEGRLQVLEDRVAYSTLTVRVREPRPEPASEPRAEPAWYDTGVMAAFLASVDGVVLALRALVVGVAYLLPYLLVFGLPLLGGALVVRRHRTKRSGDRE